MQRGDHGETASAERLAFSTYLRTGYRDRSVAPGAVEFKFNPYHDPRNGQFTFAPGTSGSTGLADGGRTTRRSPGGAPPPPRNLDPRNPRNYTVHVVGNGESLAKIAALRKGVTPDDLAWLNDIPVDGRLRIGQAIKLPTQESRDAARDAKNRFLALDYYMQTHGGRLPPNVAHPPSLQQQVFRKFGWREIKANDYMFAADESERTRYVDGDLELDSIEKRSRTRQARTGGSDRRASDDGGHYIAVRFNGPSASFNHFAQGANFNRGAYRALEDQWAKALRSGHRVHVNIIPHYGGASQRPDSLGVTWSVDGKERYKTFANRKQGQ